MADARYRAFQDGDLVDECMCQVLREDVRQALGIDGPDHVPHQSPQVDVHDVYCVDDGLGIRVVLEDAEGTLQGETATDGNGDLSQVSAGDGLSGPRITHGAS
ncbi:hypothetical protein D3C81_1794400 [compost metagenome]